MLAGFNPDQVVQYSGEVKDYQAALQGGCNFGKSISSSGSYDDVYRPVLFIDTDYFTST